MYRRLNKEFWIRNLILITIPDSFKYFPLMSFLILTLNDLHSHYRKRS